MKIISAGRNEQPSNATKCATVSHPTPPNSPERNWRKCPEILGTPALQPGLAELRLTFACPMEADEYFDDGVWREPLHFATTGRENVRFDRKNESCEQIGRGTKQFWLLRKSGSYLIRPRTGSQRRWQVNGYTGGWVESNSRCVGVWFEASNRKGTTYRDKIQWQRCGLCPVCVRVCVCGIDGCFPGIFPGTNGNCWTQRSKVRPGNFSETFASNSTRNVRPDDAGVSINNYLHN